MNLLKTDAIKKLQQQSQDEINIFSNTLKRLNNLNQQIRQQKAKRIEQINKLKAENTTLNETEKRNTKMVEKLQNFLEV